MIVGNKQDLYQDKDKARLNDYINKFGQSHAEVIFTQQGEIAFDLLDGETQSYRQPDPGHHHHHHKSKPLASDLPIPEQGFLFAQNEGEGFQSAGWRFSPDKVFNYDKLFSLLTGLCAERMKAVFITNAGVFGYNLTADALTEIQLDDCLESRIEVISDQVDNALETQLLACLSG